MLCYVMLRYVMLCYVMLCYVMLYYVDTIQIQIQAFVKVVNNINNNLVIAFYVN